MRQIRDRRDGNNIVVHSTSRTVVGLPFVHRLYMTKIIQGMMARAQEKYPVQIVAFLWMPNHVHLILTGRANLISNFNNLLNGEIAQMIKRIFPGLFQSNVWESRPHEQLIKQPHDVIEKLRYLYCNPAKANIVTSIDDYQGVSSWKMFTSGTHRLNFRWLPRRSLKPLPKILSTAQEHTLLKELEDKSPSEHYLTIHPYAWKKCFPESRNWSDDDIFQQIVRNVRIFEQDLATKRRYFPKVKKDCNDPNPDYKPTSKTPTPFVICSDKDKRRQYIQSYHNFRRTLSEAIQKIIKGKLKRPWTAKLIPRGGYLPGGILTAILLL